MAAIAVTDITATKVGKTEIGKTVKTHVMDLAFGNGTLTYPTGGVPLSVAKLGLAREVHSVQIAGAPDGFVYKWDQVNNKILIYTQGVLLGAAGLETLDDFPITAGVGVTADTHVSAKAGSATIRTGPLKEIAATDTPAATALRVVVRGW